MSDLARLAKRFPANLVHENPSGGGNYVAHHAVVQKLLLTVGPFDYAITEVLRGDVAEVPPNPQGKSARAKNGSPALTGVVVGALCTLVVTIDGRRVSITEVGDCEQPHNWPHDGARLKDAASDGIKRAAARFGCGLHLWASNEYFLDMQLEHAAKVGSGGAGTTSGSSVAANAEGNVHPQDPARPTGYADDDPERPFIVRQTETLPLGETAPV